MADLVAFLILLAGAALFAHASYRAGLQRGRQEAMTLMGNRETVTWNSSGEIVE